VHLVIAQTTTTTTKPDDNGSIGNEPAHIVIPQNVLSLSVNIVIPNSLIFFSIMDGHKSPKPFTLNNLSLSCNNNSIHLKENVKAMSKPWKYADNEVYTAPLASIIAGVLQQQYLDYHLGLVQLSLLSSGNNNSIHQYWIHISCRLSNMSRHWIITSLFIYLE
jgi:hypothetical protein